MWYYRLIAFYSDNMCHHEPEKALCPETTTVFQNAQTWKLRYQPNHADHNGKFATHEYHEHTQAKVGPVAGTDMREPNTDAYAKQRAWYSDFPKQNTGKKAIRDKDGNSRCTGACLGTNYRTDKVFVDSETFTATTTLGTLEEAKLPTMVDW